MAVHHVGEPCDTGAAYDTRALAELAALFGRAKLMDLLGALDGEIAQRLDPPDADPARLARDAHVLVSSSGALAFTALSRACAALEQACLTGDRHDGSLGAAVDAAAVARRAIAQLRTGAA